MEEKRNCFDFDKTICKKDSSIAFFFFCLKKKPSLFFHIFKIVFFMLLHAVKIVSTEKFKEKYFSFLKKLDNVDSLVEQFWQKNLKHINNWYLNMKQSTDVIASASPEFLIKAVMKKINPEAVVIATKMNKKTGKIDGKNCKGDEKVNRIYKHLKISKEKINSKAIIFENCYTDSTSDFPLFDISNNKYIVCGEKVYPFGKQKVGLTSKIKYSIKQLRVKHYLKNALIALPLFFSGKLTNWPLVLKVICTIVAFSLMCSVVYIVNDLIDAKNDRKHPKKRKRPIASYMLKKHEAIILAVVLISGSFFTCFYCVGKNLFAFYIILGYAVFNFLYSLVFKQIPIIDVICLAICYIVRLLLGGLVVGVDISNWLYLTVLFAALLMGLGKRRNEISSVKGTRKVNEAYNYQFLDKNLYVCMACIFIFYSLWAIDVHPLDPSLLNGKLLIATIPLVVGILMRYSLDIEKSTSSGDPVDVLFKDVWLIVMAFIFIVMLLVAIYVPIRIVS